MEHISCNYLYFVDTKNSVTYPTSPSERPAARACAWRKIELAKQRTVMVTGGGGGGRREECDAQHMI